MQPILDRRRSGLLVPVTALPGPREHGDLDGAMALIDWLAKTGMSVWQTLPLGIPHSDRSPYLCLSAHAGDPALIGIDWLGRQGLLQAGERQDNSNDGRYAHLFSAYENFLQTPPFGWEHEFQQFQADQSHWLEDFALFMAIRESQQDNAWVDWPPELRDRDTHALTDMGNQLAYAMRRIQFHQFLFFKQWAHIKSQANQQGILLFGDMPLFVAHDSADVWARRRCFKLRPDGYPEVVAGVPPDYFSDTGQKWGNPHYDWDNLAADDFGWWVQRLATQFELYDLVRLDHFRGLAAAWEVPFDSPTAEDGRWCEAPGYELLARLRESFGHLPLVAEDLGIITEDVVALREHFDLPTMAVLHFAFDSDEHNPYLPNNLRENSVIYTGTHDNNTTLGWFNRLSTQQQDRVMRYRDGEASDMPWPLIHCALAARPLLAIIPLQDVLSLGEQHRTNTPGTTEGNWQWRFSADQLTDELATRLLALNRHYRRSS